MLKHLFIENYALIHKLDTEFDEGLTVITGETGAGKSILLGALSMILGERADTGVLNNKLKKCIIEGSFDLQNTAIKPLFDAYDLDYENISFFRREISPNGKSRAFINDTPVNLQVMKSLAGHLIDIHSQHESLLVGSSSFQFDVVDSYARHLDRVESYRELFRQFQHKQKELEGIRQAELAARADLDYNQFQLEELNKAELDPEEFRQMEEEAGVLSHAEEILYKLEKACFLLQETESNALDIIREALSLIQPLDKFGKDYGSLRHRLESVMIELKDIAEEAGNIKDNIVHDPHQAALIESKLDLINKLLMKHHAADVEQLLKVREDFQNKIHASNSLEEKIRLLEKEAGEMEDSLHAMAADISRARSKAIPDIEDEILGLLKNLGMPYSRFHIVQKTTETLSINGNDHLVFLFNANVGGDMQDISKVASGGELSRVMLSIKSMISRKKLLPTIVFDEIDSGISGETSTKMSNILNRMSAKMQVVAITHLPQIASRGDAHLLVYKTVENGQTRTHIKPLDQEQRIIEVAKMLGGEKFTEKMVETAKELIFNKGK